MTAAATQGRWPAAVLAAAALWLATPPALAPGCEFLVLPGLMGFYALASGAPRPVRTCYVLGLLHMAAFSFSVRHVLFFPWLFIAAVGGLYYALAAIGTQALRRLGPWAFGAAVAGSAWLRAELPEICYPHGQPCHALWSWPRLLDCAAVGGEPLANLLLGALAAALVDLGRSWRVARPTWPSATAQVVAVLAVAASATWLGRPAPAGPDTERLAVAAVEPGLHPQDPFVGIDDPVAAQRRWRELFEERLLAPTRGIAGPDAAAPPDLVLWPESSLWHAVHIDAGGTARFDALRGLMLHAHTRLLLGASVARGRPGQDTPAAVLVDHAGRYLGHHEKQRLVPGGEFIPFVRWLPESVSEAIHGAFRSALGSAPDCLPGASLPLLRTRAGVPFAGLLCYDNAFPGPAAAAVRAGARLLLVLSNEAWYRGGGELDQLLAMTVLRALETRTPVVRCTTDGLTAVVGADGSILASLDKQTAPTPGARTLAFSVPLRAAGEGAVAWPGPWLGAGAALLLVGAFLHGALAWVRLRGPRTSPPADGR